MNHIEGKTNNYKDIRKNSKARHCRCYELTVNKEETMFTPHLIQQQAQQASAQSPLLMATGPPANGQPILQTSPTMMPQFFQTTPNQGSVFYTNQGQQVYNLPANSGHTMVYQTQQNQAHPPPRKVSCALHIVESVRFRKNKIKHLAPCLSCNINIVVLVIFGLIVGI